MRTGRYKEHGTHDDAGGSGLIRLNAVSGVSRGVLSFGEASLRFIDCMVPSRSLRAQEWWWSSPSRHSQQLVATDSEAGPDTHLDIDRRADTMLSRHVPQVVPLHRRALRLAVDLGREVMRCHVRLVRGSLAVDRGRHLQHQGPHQPFRREKAAAALIAYPAGDAGYGGRRIIEQQMNREQRVIGPGPVLHRHVIGQPASVNIGFTLPIYLKQQRCRTLPLARSAFDQPA